MRPFLILMKLFNVLEDKYKNIQRKLITKAIKINAENNTVITTKEPVNK